MAALAGVTQADHWDTNLICNCGNPTSNYIKNNRNQYALYCLWINFILCSYSWASRRIGYGKHSIAFKWANIECELFDTIEIRVRMHIAIEHTSCSIWTGLKIDHLSGCGWYKNKCSAYKSNYCSHFILFCFLFLFLHLIDWFNNSKSRTTFWDNRFEYFVMKWKTICTQNIDPKWQQCPSSLRLSIKLTRQYIQIYSSVNLVDRNW